MVVRAVDQGDLDVGAFQTAHDSEATEPTADNDYPVRTHGPRIPAAGDRQSSAGPWPRDIGPGMGYPDAMTTTADQSLWLTALPATPRPPLTGAHTFDVAVVGGGITGLTTALFLKRRGLNVVVLEALRVASGVSGNNTAKVTALQSTCIHRSRAPRPWRRHRLRDRLFGGGLPGRGPRIAQHTEMGAGMAVAMKDLEIRGSGNLLGGEQSGHIAGVGFDLYVRLVGEAVADFRGESPDEAAEVKVDLPIDANLPVDYLPGERLRLEAYRSLASANSDAAVDAVRAELIDRYGPIPPLVENLLAVARFKVLLRSYGVTEVSLQGNNVRFSPLDLPESAQLRLQRLYERTNYKQAVATMSVPRPKGVRKPDGSFTETKFGGEPLRDIALLTWCADVLAAVTGREAAA